MFMGLYDVVVGRHLKQGATHLNHFQSHHSLGYVHGIIICCLSAAFTRHFFKLPAKQKQEAPYLGYVHGIIFFQRAAYMRLFFLHISKE